MDAGVELIDLLPEMCPELSTLGFKGWSQEAVLDREQLRVQSNVLHLQHATHRRGLTHSRQPAERFRSGVGLGEIHLL